MVLEFTWFRQNKTEPLHQSTLQKKFLQWKFRLFSSYLIPFLIPTELACYVCQSEWRLMIADYSAIENTSGYTSEKTHLNGNELKNKGTSESSSWKIQATGQDISEKHRGFSQKSSILLNLSIILKTIRHLIVIVHKY